MRCHAQFSIPVYSSRFLLILKYFALTICKLTSSGIHLHVMRFVQITFVYVECQKPIRACVSFDLRLPYKNAHCIAIGRSKSQSHAFQSKRIIGAKICTYLLNKKFIR